MACTVGKTPLDSVLPALHGAVDDRRRLSAVERERFLLSGRDLLQIESVRHEDHVPVVQVRELHGIPLDVLSGLGSLTADMVRVDRRLIPVEVHDGVVERSGGRRGECFRDPSWRQAAFPLDDVHARSAVAVGVSRSIGETE